MDLAGLIAEMPEGDVAGSRSMCSAVDRCLFSAPLEAKLESQVSQWEGVGAMGGECGVWGKRGDNRAI